MKNIIQLESGSYLITHHHLFHHRILWYKFVVFKGGRETFFLAVTDQIAIRHFGLAMEICEFANLEMECLFAVGTKNPLVELEWFANSIGEPEAGPWHTPHQNRPKAGELLILANLPTGR